MVAEQKRFAGRMGTMPENISGAVAALGRKEGLEMAVQATKDEDRQTRPESN
jgi:hypothetical protein